MKKNKEKLIGFRVTKKMHKQIKDLEIDIGPVCRRFLEIVIEKKQKNMNIDVSFACLTFLQSLVDNWESKK